LADTDIHWHRMAEVRDIGPGEMVAKDLGKCHIAIFNIDGTFFATDNICPHAYALLSDGWLDNDVVECPLHGGQFNVRTGKALCEPADCDLRVYPVRIEDGNVEVLLPS
jgi:nitrite reductase/ring-hydroxylating ferredoxin subunit